VQVEGVLRPLAFALSAVMLVACTSTAVTTPTPLPTESAAVVDAALTDAATHLGLSRDQLHVEQLQTMQWPDSSLGCPQAGELYSQIVTPGYLLVITSAAGQKLEYHTDARSRVMLCRES
jgi:hypothetical protein